MLMLPSGDLHGMFIEMKTPDGKMSADQKAFRERAVSLDYAYSCCRSIEQFMAVVRTYLGA
jgi:hypothetical protein